MSKCEIIHVDFGSGNTFNKEYRVMDPVLARVRNEVPPETFKMYKKVVDDWMRRCFEYQMENGGIKSEGNV